MISTIYRTLRSPLKAYQRYYKRKTLAKIEAKKQQRSQYTYNPCPEVSFIIQFFNKKENIYQIFEALQSYDHAEIIVIDDGSVDGSYQEWVNLLSKPNHFLLRSNDLHEIIMYDRAMRMAKGKLVCLLQDDDVPLNNTWVNQAKLLFEHYPDMIILGGKNGLELKMPDTPKDDDDNQYTITGNVASTPGVTKYQFYTTPMHVCPQTGIEFMFSSVINRAPMFVRPKEYLHIGGTDLSFAPFQCDDVDICLRAWKNGYKVGFYKAEFKRNMNTGGMRMFNADVVPEQAMRNWKKVYELHSDFIAGQNSKLVTEANALLLGRQSS